MAERLFGTDGVRGVAGTELDCLLAYNLGRAGAVVLTQGAHRPRILVGRDSRVSGQMLESALIAGICSVGAEAVPVGVVPTPAVAWMTGHIGADAGVMISASHNPMEYNGIKFFDSRAQKLSDELEDRIEALLSQPERLPAATGSGVGRVIPAGDAVEQYVDHLCSLPGPDLSGLTIVMDCANGAASRIGPRVYRCRGANVIPIHNEPDGLNINRACGSTDMASLQAAVREYGAHAGVAFDGDADRCLAVDEKGAVVDGDHILLLCAEQLQRRGELAGNTLVATVMSNLGLELAARQRGITLRRTAVGDRYVLEEMLRGGYSLGGEQSGHIIFLSHNATGDGLATGLALLSAMKTEKQPLSVLAARMTSMPQVLVNVPLRPESRGLLAQDEQIAAAITAVEQRWGERGRVLVRESGTEPLVRVMLEGPEQAAIEEDARRIAHLIARRLGP